MKRFALALSSLALVGSMVITGPVFASDENNPTKLLETVGGKLETGTKVGSDLPTVVGRVLNTMFGLLGIIAVVLIVYAGFKWMTSAGGDGVGDAKKILISAAIGLFLILTAYAITSFVLTRLISATV